MTVKQTEKQGFWARTKKFLRASLNELKKVHWSNKKELTTYSIVVVVSVLFVSGIIWVFDSVLSLIMGFII
ncbi:MAG: preprotein translocase subunit SecE [Eubacteriales bacterium]|jgi:preprotein translocase subunit SecE|nr:preprotein translocase subunit SecE [Eubacteriales bacterium]NCC81745.1 preprotein translocase subunit SecE [Clostridia bacterium]